MTVVGIKDKLDLALLNEEYFFWQVPLTIEDVPGVKTHGPEGRQERPEEVRVLVRQEAELVNDLKEGLLDHIRPQRGRQLIQKVP